MGNEVVDFWSPADEGNQVHRYHTKYKNVIAKLYRALHNASLEYVVQAGLLRSQEGAEIHMNWLNVWCAAFQTGSHHGPHHHPRATVSGVYYAKVLPGSSPISFHDPRGGNM